jgi:tetratricopeptide (TPR) repeat protein
MTSRKGKGTEKPRAKKLSNPASTGGGGTSFESRVQASRLLAMCLGLSVPGAPDGRIVELRFQARIHGHHTDDLVCDIQRSDGQRIRTLLQMKRSLAAREKEAAFAESIGAAWTDYNSDKFVRGQDSIYLVYDTASAAAMKGASTVCTWARYSATAEEFLKKVNAQDFSNAANRNALAAIRKIAERYAGQAIDDEVLYDFVKHLHCLSHDLDQDGTAEHVSHLNAIRQAAALFGEIVRPQEIWSALATACMTANGAAGTVTFDNLDTVIGAHLNGLFAAARNFGASPFAVVPLAKQSASRAASPDAVAAELARLAGLVESLNKTSLQSAAQDQVPESSDDSVNKLISGQLDGVHARIKVLRYQDALEDLVRIGDSREQFDAHQEARWHLLRGTCKWHLEGGEAAAADFIRAAELRNDEDKFAAAGIRGLLLQGDAVAAAAAGAEALKAFPNSLAVWQVTANARMNLGETLTFEDIPTTLRNEADALQMLAWSRHRHKDGIGAVRFALQALDAATPSFFTRDTALSLCLDQAAGDGVSAAFRVFGTEDRSALERCVGEFSPREERLWRVQSPETVATTVANLATAHLLLGRPDVALAVLQESRSHAIDAPIFMRVELEAMAAVGDRAAAIALGRSKIVGMQREALATFAQLAAEADDLEAVDQAIDAAKRLQPDQPVLVRNLSGMRWTVLARSSEEAALEAVRAVDWATAHSVPELVAAAQVLRNAGFVSEAALRTQRAMELLPQSIETADRYLVAQSLLSAREFVQAIALFEQLAPLGKHSQLHADLLFCYLRSGQRAKAKRLVDAFPAGWELHTDTRQMAMDLGQLAGDWALLSRLVPAEFDQASGEVRSWLLKVMVAARTSAEEVSTVLKDAPYDLSGSTQEVTQLATLELRHGYKERALRRLYVMRRKRLDSTEVAAAHVVALLAVTDELPLMEEELSEVAPGTSVTVADAAGKDQVFTIDPSNLPGLPATSEFLSPGSKEAATLVGLMIGTEFSVPDTRGESRKLIVQRICSAYRRLLELSQLALNAPLAPSPMARAVLIHNEETGEADFSGLTQQLKQFNDRAKRTIDLYASSPITLGGLAKMLGRDVLDVVRGWRPEGPPIQVSGGNPKERAEVISRLVSSKGPYIVDGATLVELASLECLDVLAALPSVLVTSYTRDSLQAKLAEAKTERTAGTAFERDGKLGFIEVTAEQRQREVHFLQTVVDAIRTHCNVVPAYGTDATAPIATQLERALSVEEFSVVLAAAEYGATLVSLDARLRSLAAHLGISGVWPQVLLMYARDIGQLAAASYSMATVRQLFSNRTFISLASGDLVLMTYQGTDWLKFGLSRLARHLALPETEFESAFRVAVEYLQRLATEGPCHFGAVCRILQQIAEALFRHKDGQKDLEQTLSFAAFRALPMGEDAAVRKQLLRAAIREGLEASRKPTPGELKDVQVLMCSAPPLIAYVEEGPSENSSHVGLKAIAALRQDEQSIAVAGPTSASDAADNPYR